jgi:hypothetical protein
VHSLPYSAWAKAYYDQQRGKGKPRNTVLRALAFKWIRVLFHCWKDRKPYCEEIYRQALHRRKQMATSSPVQLRVSEAPKDLEAWLALALFEHVFVLRVTYRECSLWSRTYHELCAEHAGHSSEE